MTGGKKITEWCYFPCYQVRQLKFWFGGRWRSKTCIHRFYSRFFHNVISWGKFLWPTVHHWMLQLQGLATMTYWIQSPALFLGDREPPNRAQQGLIRNQRVTSWRPHWCLLLQSLVFFRRPKDTFYDKPHIQLYSQYSHTAVLIRLTYNIYLGSQKMIS